MLLLKKLFVIDLESKDTQPSSSSSKSFFFSYLLLLINLRNGQLHSDYDKERTVKAFVDFVKKKSGPAYTTIQDQGAWNAFIGETALTHIVAFLPAGDNAAFLETYEKIASSPDFDGFSFGYVSDESLTTSLSQKANVIAIYRNGELESVYSDTLTNEGITAYLNKNGFPLLEKLDMSQSFIQRSVKRQVPLLIIFRGGEEAELKEQYDFAKKVAETNELRVSVLESEASAYPNLVSQWGASGQKFPTAILVKFQGKGVEIKAYDEEKELTVESVLSWAQSCVDGKACPTFLKSEPIPETEEPVKVVVGRTFESIVFDTTKDVLLEIYSPTCPHCKAVVKPYTELAERYANDEKVVIAKIDGTKNSLPDSVNVRGYPTFLLFKASDKANPITYSKGERTLENFVDFIEENRAPKGDDNKNVKDEL